MKLKALANLCKSNGEFLLFDRMGEGGEVIEQWLGTRAAIYPLHSIPFLSEKNIPILFDITESQRKKIIVVHTPLPNIINPKDVIADEIMLARESMTIGIENRIWRPLMTPVGTLLLNDDYFAPLADAANEIELYLRTDTGGIHYIAAKVGMMVVGIMRPKLTIPERLVENLEELAINLRDVLSKKSTQGSAQDDEQVNIFDAPAE